MRGTTSWAYRLVALVAAACLVACGGSSDDAVTPTPGGGHATLGAAGGEVLAEDGARISVPPEALAVTTTLRIAKNASGAPALPPQLVPAGDVYALTPHGTSFGTRAARFSMPAPTLSLQANQALRLARAQAGGEWEVLLDSGVENGELVASLSGFSYYQPVIVTYLAPVATVPPLAFSVALSCGTQDCDNLSGLVDYTFTVSTNNGVLPEGCQWPELAVTQGVAGGGGTLVGSLPITGGTLTRRAAPSGSFGSDYRVVVNAMLRCQGSAWSSYSRAAGMRWRAVPASSYGITPSLDCGAFDCNAIAESRANITYSIASNGVVPTNCSNARIVVRIGWANDGYATTEGTFYLPIEGGSDTRQYSAPPNRRRAVWTPALECNNGGSHYELPDKSAYFAPPAAPTVTVPQPVLVLTGQTASFDSQVTGVPRPAIRWQTRPANSTGAWADVTDGQGADGMHFTTAMLGTAHNGQQYRVVASNTLGTVQSAVVTVSVSDQALAPTITTQPAAQNVSAGNEAVFVAAASGTEALSWQWLFNGVPMRGANAPVLKVSSADATRQGNYSVEVRNGSGKATSLPAQLTVTPGTPAALAPAIVTQPAAVTVNTGNTATFAVGVNGSSPFGFQWRRDGVAIAGATEAAYTLAAVAESDAGSYSVVVSNGAGSVTSNAAALSVTPQAAAQAPAISTQPAALVVLPGATATLAVAASGTAPLAYQWSRNGTPIAGANGAVLTIAGATALDAGSYTVSVTNSAGSAASTPAALMLVGAPAISAQPAAASATEGSTASFNVGATGDALRYQWTRNSVAIANATAASYTTPALTLADHGTVFGVVVYNGAGLAMSQGAVLTVTAAPAGAWGGAATVSGTGGATYEPSVVFSTGTSAQAYAVWGQNDAASGLGMIQFSQRASTGAWSLPVAISGSFTRAYAPRIAANDGGAAAAVWGYAGENGPPYHLAVNRYASGSWGTPQQLDTGSGGNSSEPRIAIDDQGRVLVVWVQHTGTRYAVWASTWVSGSWSVPAVIDGDAAGGSMDVSLALDYRGYGYVAWSQGNAARVANFSFMSGFDTAQTLSTGTAYRPTLGGVDEGGQGMLAWLQGNAAGGHDIMASRTTSRVWGAAGVAQADAGFADALVLAVDGGSGAQLAWTQQAAGQAAQAVWSKRYSPSSGWAAAEPRSLANLRAETPRIAVSMGRHVLMWNQRGSDNLTRPYAADWTGSAWLAAQPIANSGVDTTNTALALSQAGAVALWTSAGSPFPLLASFLP